MRQGCRKYKPFAPIALPDRTWPDKTITQAPVWCSVDLRDGNQALVNPMNLEQKLEFFQTLCEIGFTEIEVGFPASSETEYEILRALIDQDLIPDGGDGAGAGPGPGAPDPQDLRGHPGGQKRHHPLLQLHLHPPAAGGVPHGHGRASSRSP